VRSTIKYPSGFAGSKGLDEEEKDTRRDRERKERK
jgi:hypothetical protein